ncbi:MAG: AN1-type zinc finger domain-containing protein [Methanococcoides sp.]|nr:AN1-type zinc finger domain-containing protein [Methanococcoides sp.]
MGVMDRDYSSNDKGNLRPYGEDTKNRRKCFYCGTIPDSTKNRRYTGGRMDIMEGVPQFLFKCHRCGHSYCEKHRLPEQHECIGLPQNIKKMNRMVNNILTENEKETLKNNETILINVSKDSTYQNQTAKANDFEKKKKMVNSILTENEKTIASHKNKKQSKVNNSVKKTNTTKSNVSEEPKLHSKTINTNFEKKKKMVNEILTENEVKIAHNNDNSENKNKKTKGKYKHNSDENKLNNQKEKTWYSTKRLLAAMLIFVVLMSGSYIVFTNIGDFSLWDSYESIDVPSIQFIKASGEPIVLVDNEFAHDVTWDELITFIKSDDTDQIVYNDGSFICGDFAERLHNNAEKAGIQSAFVSIDFYDDVNGHALNAFETTDKGLVYVDCTGPTQPIGELDSYDKIGYIEVGEEYGLISAYYTKDPTYTFYENRNKNMRGFFESPGTIKSVNIYWTQNSF